MYFTLGVMLKVAMLGDPVLKPKKLFPPEHTPKHVPEIEILVTARSLVEAVYVTVPVPGVITQFPLVVS